MNRSFFLFFLLFLIFRISEVGAISADSLFNKARSAAHGGNYEEALKTLDTLLESTPENSDALLLKGMIYLWQKKYDDSRKLLSEVVTSAPHYKDAWVALVKASLWSGDHTAACSTLHYADSVFGSDSLLLSLRDDACHPEKHESAEVTKQISELHLFGGTGISLFEKSYHRYPWAHFTGGIDLKKTRWGVGAVINAERRKYDTLTFYGAELQIAPRVAPLPNVVTTLYLSLSPYSLVDTVYASYSAKLECTAGLPGGIEVDGAARFGWYGDNFSPYYSLGAGKYLANYLIAGRLFVATLDRKAYLSGVATLRRFGKKNERHYLQAGFAMGRTPYDGGTLTPNGYLSFMEGQVKCALPLSVLSLVEPSLSVAGEQLVQKSDFNNDGSSDLRISEIRLRLSFFLIFHFKRG